MERSRGIYRKATRLKPEYPPAHYALANALFAQQRTDDARREYREVLRLRPDFPGVHLSLGALAEAQGTMRRPWRNTC